MASSIALSAQDCNERTCSISPINFNAYRLGVSIGNAYHKAQLKNVISDTNLPGMDIKGKKHDLIKNSPAVGAFFGYDHIFEETTIFIGAEMALVNHNFEKSVRSVFKGRTYLLTLKTNNSTTGALRLGILVKDVLIYGKTGLSSTNWNVLVKSPYGNNQKKFQKTGYVFGFGCEFKLNNTFSLGLEHEFTKHSRLTSIHPVVDIKITPIVQTTNLRLIYNF